MRPFLALAGTLLALAPSPAALGVTPKPALHIDGRMLLGVRFHAREQVQIRFIADSRQAATVTTDRAGSFTMPFPSLASCLRPLTIKALGAHGDTAMLKVAKRACMPQ